MKIRNLAAATVLALTASSANATLLDLTTAGASGTINQALFRNTPVQPAGSGVIESFVRVQDANSGGQNPTGLQVEGYNTSTRPVAYDETSDPFTHDLLVNQVGIVTISGVNYWKFLLDINQNNGQSNELLSLDKLQLFMGNGDSGVAGLASLSDDQLIYDLDAGGDNAIKLDATLNGGGSGISDMFAFIKVPTLTAADLTKKLSLYSQFGATLPFTNNDGYEEWARFAGDTSACIPTVENNFCGSTPPSPAPEPGILALLATALLGFGFKARSKKAD